MQLYGHVVLLREPFKLPTGMIVLGNLATGCVVKPLLCDACRVVMY